MKKINELINNKTYLAFFEKTNKQKKQKKNNHINSSFLTMKI